MHPSTIRVAEHSANGTPCILFVVGVQSEAPDHLQHRCRAVLKGKGFSPYSQHHNKDAGFSPGGNRIFPTPFLKSPWYHSRRERFRRQQGPSGP